MRDTATLTEAQRLYLRDLARLTIDAVVRGRAAPDPEAMAAVTGAPLSGALAEPRGAFVTLRRGGDLRGCIGSIQSERSLARTVARSARNAAVADPRFPAVGVDELPHLDLEISALSALADVVGPDEIEIGIHGILLDCRGRQAVFLPQVAPEQGWDLTTTLDELAAKAGLAPGEWREGARFRVFTAEVF